MTTELEEQFYNMFGIETKNKCGKSLIYPNCLNPDKCGYDNCIYYQIEHPEITDRILLKLICKAYCLMFPIQGSSIEFLKENILKEFIYWQEDVDKSEIQELFKGEE